MLEIVVKIPQELYEMVKDLDKNHVVLQDNRQLCSAIASGTVLPEKHGDLIDRDDLIYEDVDCEDGNTYMVVHAGYIDAAEAIIESNKA